LKDVNFSVDRKYIESKITKTHKPTYNLTVRANELTYEVSELPLVCSFWIDGLIMCLDYYNLGAGLLLFDELPFCGVVLIGHEDLRVPSYNSK
jgi:hypothetical protein